MDPATLEGGIGQLNTRTEDLDEGLFTGAVQSSVATGLIAVGTNRATSLALADRVNVVTGGDTGTGVDLPTISSPSQDVLVFNDSGVNLKVYAPDSATIDGVAGSTGVTLTDAKRCAFYSIDETTWVSAQLGVKSA